MFLQDSYIYNKFVNALIKKGKKTKIQKIFHKFFYNFNSTIFYGYWYFINQEVSNKVKIYSNDLLGNNQRKSSRSTLNLPAKNFTKKKFSSYIKNRYSNFIYLFGSPNPLLALLTTSSRESKAVAASSHLNLTKNVFYKIYVHLFNKHFKCMRLKEFRTVRDSEKKSRSLLLKDFWYFLREINENFFKKSILSAQACTNTKTSTMKFFKSLHNSVCGGEFGLYPYASRSKRYKIKNSELIPTFEPGGSRLSKFFFFREAAKNKNILYNFAIKFIKFRSSRFRRRLRIKSTKNKSFLYLYNSMHKVSYFYSRFAFMQLNFFVSQFLVFQIIYSLIPFLGLRMTSVQNVGKSLKKKGKRRRPYGVPIVLSQSTQITYALGFFKKSFTASINKNKLMKRDSFKEILSEELLSFLFFKNTVSLRLKKDLYRRIIDFRSNFHFRWLTSHVAFKLKDYLIDKSNISY